MRDTTHQSCHLPARAPFGKRLQQLAAGIHQADHIPGKRFAECNRRGHRQGSDDIEPDIAPAQGTENLDEQAGKDRQRCDGPDKTGIARIMP